MEKKETTYPKTTLCDTTYILEYEEYKEYCEANDCEPHHRPRFQPNRGGSPKYNGGFRNGNGRPQGKPNRSGPRVRLGQGKAGSFNRGGSIGGRPQSGQRNWHR